MKEKIESQSDIDPKVIASLAENYAAYYRRKEDQENFYKASLQFLAYTPVEEMTTEEKKQWSIKMGMAVLLGKNIFNISELVSVPSDLLTTFCCSSWTKKSSKCL